MNKFLAFCALMLVMCVPGQARDRYFNYCQQGGDPVFVANIKVDTPVQRTYPGCTIQVNNSGTSTLTTLYADNSGTPLANPFTADMTTGYFEFYADNGTVDLLFSGAGIVTPFTWAGVGIIDPINVPFVVNYVYPAAGGASLAAQCTSAATAKATLVFSAPVLAIPTTTCNANIAFVSNGQLQPASAAVFIETASITAPPVKIFDYSLGGTISITYPPSKAPIQWWGGLGDDTFDNSPVTRNAMASVCGGVNPGDVDYSPGSYLHLTTVTWAGQNCTLSGSGSEGSVLIFTPTSGSVNTVDGLVFAFSTEYGGGNAIRDLLFRAGNTRIRRLISSVNQTGFLIDNVTTRSGNLAGVTALWWSGGVVSNVNNSRFLDGGSAATVVVAASPAPVTTTVTFNGGNVETGSDACMDLGGSSGAGSIVVQNVTIEACAVGLRAGTNIVLYGNHFEFNAASIVVPNGTGALIQATNNNYQQCGSLGGTFFSLKSGTTMTSTNDTTDLAAGCTLYNAPTGSHVSTIGPQLPPGVFPSGVINSGDPLAMEAPVISKFTFPFAGVSGDFTTQAFRGSTWDIGVAGTTVLHIGESNLGFPAGETWTFILQTNGSSVTFSSANMNDYPVSGIINNTGIASGKFQVVVLKLDSHGHFVIQSSPGWQTY